MYPFEFKITKDVTLKEGTTVFVDTPEAKLNNLVERGYVDEAEAEERLSKIPEWKKYVLTVKK